MNKTDIPVELKSHFLRLYQIALSDGDFSTLEMKMLYDFARSRGISEEHMNKLLLEPKDTVNLVPDNIEKKIEYLCDFAYMIWADGIVDENERISLKKYIKLFGFLDDNIEKLADYLIEATGEGKNKEDILKELNT